MENQHDAIQEHKIRRQYGLHLVHLRPGGISLTEEHHDDRRDDQAERITQRIDEIMASPDPLTGLFSAKLAHRGIGHDALFDEAIEACKKVFNFDFVAVKSSAMLAMQKEDERKARIRELARSAARRAGLEVEDDNGESLIPRVINAGPTLNKARLATLEELTDDVMDMAGRDADSGELLMTRETAAKIAQARLEGKFGDSGRYITKKENSNAGTGTDGGAKS